MKIKYWNSLSSPAEIRSLQPEVDKILSVDIDNQFRFEITFIGSGHTGLNNFLCKVYPLCGDDLTELLGTLQRGDEYLMRQIKQDYNEFQKCCD